MAGRVNYSGIVVAGIGFFLTRFTVTLAIYEEPVRFYLSGVVPLVLGLGLAAFGVALAVADVEASFVRTTALWCVLGVGTMAVLVAVTVLGSVEGGLPDVATIRSQAYLSNVLIAGAAGGTLTGLYAARNRQQRDELRHQANRLEVLNRLLRHEVLNALTAIRGYAGLDSSEETRRVIEAQTDAIQRTVEDVKYLTRSARTSHELVGSVDPETYLRGAVETVRQASPGADISLSVDSGSPAPTVRANDRLTHVFEQLLENAITYSGDEEPVVDVSLVETADSVRVSVRDGGPGLPEGQQALLETGAIERFDNPESGYGLNIVRLLVESYHGGIETEVNDDGSTITVVLPRDDTAGSVVRSAPASVLPVRPVGPPLLVSLLAALVAGVGYGLVSETLGGSIAGIGVFYGIANPVVGWITHQFHSIVFGFVYVGIVSVLPTRYRNSPLAFVGVGIVWALCLWLGAAGVIAPLWLRLLGIDASVPNLSVPLFASHLTWGITLGVFTALGNRYLTPTLARFRTDRNA